MSNDSNNPSEQDDGSKFIDSFMNNIENAGVKSIANIYIGEHPRIMLTLGVVRGFELNKEFTAAFPFLDEDTTLRFSLVVAFQLEKNN